MTGPAVAAAALALALLVAPASPRRRLATLCPAPAKLRMAYRSRVIAAAAAVSVASALVVPATAVVAVVIAAVTLAVRLRQRETRRRRVEESRALQDALDVLVGELRVGAHPVAAFSIAASEVGGPVAASFREVAARARFGADVPSGLHTAALTAALPSHWERVAVSWQLAQTHGLAIATLMRTAHRDIVERERFSARASAGMAGARTTAAVLAGLPLLGVGLGQLIGADPLSFLLSGHAGGWLLVVGVTLGCCGLLWSDHITAGVLS
ncbi:MAG: type secretion system protein [Mycobacterium sp.]|nr:type secretion system protein [Mycobacterium sp.]